MYVLALPYPDNTDLPDILQEDDGKVMYFKDKHEAKVFMQELYDERGIMLRPFVNDLVEIMRRSDLEHTTNLQIKDIVCKFG